MLDAYTSSILGFLLRIALDAATLLTMILRAFLSIIFTLAEVSIASAHQDRIIQLTGTQDALNRSSIAL